MSMTWDELHALQRKLAEWLEPWGSEGNELYREVARESDGACAREHLAWFANQRVAALVAEMHNGMMFLINALIMHERLAADRARKIKTKTDEDEEKSDD